MADASRIGPEGLLYVTTGWTENGSLPQDLSSLAGKVLRMTRDGRVPGDNPFKGSYVYSYGHRNPQGLAWNAAGDLFIAEHGQSGHDEINLIKPGANYGWPLVSGAKGDQEWSYPASLRQRYLGSIRCHVRGTRTARGGTCQARLYAFDASTGSMKLVFSSGDRLRDVMAVGRELYVITTNRSPRDHGPSRPVVEAVA